MQFWPARQKRYWWQYRAETVLTHVVSWSFEMTVKCEQFIKVDDERILMEVTSPSSLCRPTWELWSTSSNNQLCKHYWAASFEWHLSDILVAPSLSDLTQIFLWHRVTHSYLVEIALSYRLRVKVAVEVTNKWQMTIEHTIPFSLGLPLLLNCDLNCVCVVCSILTPPPQKVPPWRAMRQEKSLRVILPQHSAMSQSTI